MRRAYSVASVAFAVGAAPRWVDNLLARHDVPGVARRGRGVELAISADGLLAIAVARALVAELGMAVAPAAALAAKLVASPGGSAPAGARLAVHLDRPALERDLAARLVEAADAIAPRRRGRPPRRGSRTTADDRR